MGTEVMTSTYANMEWLSAITDKLKQLTKDTMRENSEYAAHQIVDALVLPHRGNRAQIQTIRALIQNHRDHAEQDPQRFTTELFRHMQMAVDDYAYDHAEDKVKPNAETD